MAENDGGWRAHLGFVKVFRNRAGHFHFVTHLDGNVWREEPQSAVGALAILDAHVGSVNPGHNSSSHHHRVGKHPRFLANLDVRNGSQFHNEARAIVEIRRRVVVRCSCIGAAPRANCDGCHHAQGRVRTNRTVVVVHAGSVEGVRADANAGGVTQDRSNVEGFGVAKRLPRLGIDVAVHVVVASKVGPNHRRARLNAQGRRVELKAARFHQHAIHVAWVVKQAGAIVLRSVRIVVRCIRVRATQDRWAASVERVHRQIGPIVAGQDNPLAVFRRGSCTGDPVTSIA